MRLTLRLIGFFTIFTIVFYIFRFHILADQGQLVRDLNGVAWLYTTVGLIFSIISAFIIQTQWRRWDRLESAVKGEVDGFWELIMFSEQLPDKIDSEIKTSVKKYLALTIEESWRSVDKRERSVEIDLELKNLQRNIVALMKVAPHRAGSVQTIFTSILKNRSDRIHYGTGKLPLLLYVLIAVSTVLVIMLSLFISVTNPWLDYVFTLSIGLLSFLIIIVIEDLNHPFRPGIWHLTKEPYKNLLFEIE